MVPVLHSDGLERVLAARVARMVHGRGIPPARVRAAVRQVVVALAGHAAPPTGDAPPQPGHAPVPTVLAVLAAARPDLASATRAACAGVGVAVASLGAGAAGRHTVVTLVIPAAARAAVAAVAESIGARLTLLDVPAG